jgi:hypothetical protein
VLLMEACSLELCKACDVAPEIESLDNTLISASSSRTNVVRRVSDRSLLTIRLPAFPALEYTANITPDNKNKDRDQLKLVFFFFCNFDLLTKQQNKI